MPMCTIALGFLSTLSLRRATRNKVSEFVANPHFYPRSPCGERPLPRFQPGSGFPISIHALLAESDSVAGVYDTVTRDFYPRSPCGERQLGSLIPTRAKKFLSTLSLRRATRPMIPTTPPAKNFYPRSPCGERLYSIDSGTSTGQFLSTLSLRRATAATILLRARTIDFYPRSPCGERLGCPLCAHHHPPISIHALLAESDLDGDAYEAAFGISIHALLAESDHASNTAS